MTVETSGNAPATGQHYTWNNHTNSWEAKSNFPFLTKREYFAAMALQGMISRKDLDLDLHWSFAAKESVQYADALIKQLNEPKG